MYLWIDNIITGLKETYGINNIYDLYDFLNIKIINLEQNNILLSNNEAFYYRNYLGSEIVFIRNDLNFSYAKFILAHELGHALLHTHIYEATFNKKNLINMGKLEKQANYFAIKLLNIELDPIECEGFTLKQIASYLEIPENLLNGMVEK